MTIEENAIVLQLQALLGGALSIAALVTERLRQTQPDVHRTALHLVKTGAGTLEFRVLFEPDPAVIVLIRLADESGLELAKFKIPAPAPDIGAWH